MKRVLLISAVIPDENGIGVHRRVSNYLKSLHCSFEIHLWAFQPYYKGNTIPDNLAKLCHHTELHPVTVQPIPQLPPPLSYLYEWVKPSHERHMPSKEQLGKLADYINKHQFDTIFCFRIRASEILDHLERRSMITPNYKKIVDFDDIESISVKREMEKKGKDAGVEYRFIQKLRIERLKALEKKYLQSFDEVLTCSEIDKKRLEKLSPKANIVSTPNCITLPETSHVNSEDEVINILFVGTLHYLPNEDAILWFVNDMYSQLMAKSDKPISLTIVGYDPSPKVKALASQPNVTVTGGVASVIPYYEHCHFVICPIRFGGGTRIKILEAFSHAKAVVSTTIGSEGIEAEHNKSIVLADTEAEFIDACLSLINSASKRQAIGEEAKACVANNYTVDIIGEKLRLIM